MEGSSSGVRMLCLVQWQHWEIHACRDALAAQSISPPQAASFTFQGCPVIITWLQKRTELEREERREALNEVNLPLLLLKEAVTGQVERSLERCDSGERDIKPYQNKR